MQMQMGGDSDFHLNEFKALIEPGYQYIAAPYNDYLMFENELREDFGEDINCTSYNWCYIMKSCEDAGIGDLEIFMSSDDLIDHTGFTIPSSSFTETTYDNIISREICNVYVVG